METFQLRYFKSVAETQNIHKSAKLLNISASALSKAIRQLENELEVQLFQRVGRNIQISSEGSKLQKEVIELLALEKNILMKFKENLIDTTIKIAGPDIALSHWSAKLIKSISKSNSEISFELSSVSNEEVMKLVENYSVDIGILCSPTKKSGKFFKELSKTTFRAYISKKHPLYSKRTVPIDDLLNYNFISGDKSLYGLNQSFASSDGWRDDKFARKITTVTNSLKTLEKLTHEGLAVAYLPEYLGNSLNLEELKIVGCPYHCTQYIYAVRNKYCLESLWSLIE